MAKPDVDVAGASKVDRCTRALVELVALDDLSVEITDRGIVFTEWQDPVRWREQEDYNVRDEKAWTEARAAVAALGAASPFAHVAPETDDQNHPAQTAGQPAPQAEPLRRLWPLIEKAMAGLVFTTEKAGEVAADMQILRSAQAGAVQPAAPAERKAVLHWSDGSRTVVPCPPDDTATYTAKLVQPAADALTNAAQRVLDQTVAQGDYGRVPAGALKDLHAALRGTAPKAAE